MENLRCCELCGKNYILVDAIIEGSVLSVCHECAQFGKIVVLPKKQEKIELKKVQRKEEPLEIISPSYSKRIKQAREKLGFKQGELAEKIGEKESTIHQLESGHLKPSLVLARKLEKFLHITLIEVSSLPEKNLVNFSDTSLTIGDLLKLKKK